MSTSTLRPAAPWRRGVPVERPVVRNNAPSLSPAIISLGLHTKLKTKDDPR
jgi:hypothetical protein